MNYLRRKNWSKSLLNRSKYKSVWKFLKSPKFKSNKITNKRQITRTFWRIICYCLKYIKQYKNHIFYYKSLGRFLWDSISISNIFLPRRIEIYNLVRLEPLNESLNQIKRKNLFTKLLTKKANKILTPFLIILLGNFNHLLV